MTSAGKRDGIAVPSTYDYGLSRHVSGASGRQPCRSRAAGRAWALETHDLRQFGIGKHQNIDDTPAGGGAGMVLRADVAAAALDQATQSLTMPLPVLLPSPRGRVFSQELALELAAGPGVIFLCNRYEGVDQRFIEARAPIEVSLGDYILSGGEMAALTMLDAMVRLIPGVMGKVASGDDESFSQGLLEYPHYTRPQSAGEGRAIPDIVTAGDHEKNRRWRQEEAERLTRERRPDLWAEYKGGDG